MAVKDGGPAFPVECNWIRTGDDIELRGIQTGNFTGWYEGMTLRDWFAGQALAAAAFSIVMNQRGHHDFEAHLSVIAEAAYKQADAMLKERERP